MRRKVVWTALVFAVALSACRPPETFEAEGIRLHDAAEQCSKDFIAEWERVPMAKRNVASRDAFESAAVKRCEPLKAASAAHIVKAEQLRADGVIK